MKAGVRVVRGPDWDRGRQDGGQGGVGTIVYVPKEGSSDSQVTVIWDSGRELRYRAGKDGKYDLRLLDNSQIGVVHGTITCDECMENPVIGMRWKCSTCTDYDLCTKCYMSNKHDVSHGFMRMASDKARAFGVRPRHFCKAQKVFGVYAGATVMRGPHWKWKNDDGGAAEEGKVTEVIKWKDQKNDCPRGGVKVKWAATRKEGAYRMGGEGCVDVIYTEESNGPIRYYLEHLPLVDIISSGDIILKRSDKVRVNLEEKEFEQLQDNKVYGGWDAGMKQCLTELGTIVDLLYEGITAKLQFADAKIWIVNRQSLTRIHSFTPGEAVTVMDEVNSVKDLQEGHGGWNADMTSTLGKIGRIVRIGDDGDLRVKVDDKTWIYSPVCCMPVEDLSVARSVPELTKDELTKEEDDLTIMKRHADRMAVQLADLFVGLLRAIPADEDDDMSLVEAAAKNDLDTLKSIVSKSPDRVNATHEHKTGLQLACYEGHREVVKYLLDNKADVNLADEEGDTALQFAAFGQEENSMQLLLKHGAKKDWQNKKGQTALHISLGKGSITCTKLLVEKGASVNIKDNDGDSPLHDCIVQKKRQSLLIGYVFKAGNADFSVQNKRGFNVLHWAALKDCRKAADIMIEKKPGLLNAKMPEDFTALHICAANNHTEIGSALLKAKAEINPVDKNRRSPLHIAVSQSHKRIIELLLIYGADVNLQDEGGNSPLHVAQISKALPDQLARLLGVQVKNDDTGIQISCLLIEAGADINKKNKKGQTPVDLCGDEATREFMKKLAEQASKKTFETSKKGVMLPTHWAQMDKQELFIRVTLDVNNGLLNKEFQGVRNNFCRTLPQARIVKIERVQNRFMWEHYYLKRRQFEYAYGAGCVNELDLYHGTYPHLVDIICINNLDPRLSGERVGTLFGQGTYFAKESKYSDGYAVADDVGNKYMFQCRVLAGKYTYGNPKLKRPPPLDAKDSNSRLYDCCVDDVDRPRIFCLFDCNQYYPEYVIQYQ